MRQSPFKNFTKELGCVVVALVCMFLISAVSSFASAGLDLSKINTPENITNMCLNAAVTIFGTIVAIPLGNTYTKQLTLPNGTPGKFIFEHNAYVAVRNAVEKKLLKFSQWHHAQYLEEIRQKQEAYLLGEGVQQAVDVMSLSKEQILQLTEPQCFNIDERKVYFKALTHAQIRACVAVRTGKITVRKLPDNYFLYVDGKSSTSFYDQAHNEAVDKTMMLVTRLSYKVFVGFVITSIFTSLVIAKLSDDVTTREYIIKSLINVFARVFNAVSSAYWGFQIGQEQVYKQCYYINGKTQFLQKFEDDVTFEERSLQDLAKEDFENEKGDVIVESEDEVQTDILE